MELVDILKKALLIIEPISCQNFHLRYIYVNDDNVTFVQDLSIQREITRRNPNEFLIPLIN